MIFNPCSSSVCLFDKTPTESIIFFEIFTLVSVVLLLWILSRNIKHIWLKFGVMAMGIFIFEFFTHPLWYNLKMGSWAYVYRDVSWILTFGWSILIMVPIEIIDSLGKKLDEWKRFFLYLLSGLFLGILGETVVVNLGIRWYSPETLEVIAGKFIPFLNIPLASLYYIPVFMALVIGFYKYWSFVIDKKLLVPIKKRRWVRDFIIAFVGVFLFEIMVEAMVTNARLPSWSYIYRDVSFLMTGGWIIIIWLAVSFVDKFFIHFDLVERFILYIFSATLITLPIEALLILNKFRLYGPSSTENFSGFIIPLTTIPIEVAFAIPFYLSLIVAFNKYWMYILDNKK
jgi:hypothetical protein